MNATKWPSLVCVVIAMCVSVAPARAEWREYTFADQQFAASFPVSPSVAAVPQRTPDGLAVTELVYGAQMDGARFQITVFDLLSVRMNGPAAVERAAWRVREKGEVKLDAVAEVQGNWGRDLHVVGLDGSHTIAAVFFRNDRLYVIETTASAADFDSASSEMIRFQQSLRFVGSPRLRRFGQRSETQLQNIGGRVFGAGAR